VRGQTNVRTCWEIRADIESSAGNGKPEAWLRACTDCPVRFGGQPCWAQCGEPNRCCVPVHVTCDFCVLYIEHRHEIAARMLSDQAPAGAAASRYMHLEGEMSGMEKTQFSIPEMWADHHVLKVRQALTALPGVQDVIASSAFRAVAVSYDPKLTTPEAIASALAGAGYPASSDGQGLATQPVPVQDGRKDPAWDRLGFRAAHTDPRDAKR